MSATDTAVWTTCDLCDVGHEVAGEEVAPGLAIVCLDGLHDAKAWSVTHIRSGHGVVFACCEDEARRIARIMADLHDWDHPAEYLRERQRGIKDRMALARVFAGRISWCSLCLDGEDHL